MEILSLKFIPSSGVILTFFPIVNQLPGFSISRLANVGDFSNVNIFFKCKLNINVTVNDHSLYLCSMLLETSFTSPVLQSQF